MEQKSLSSLTKKYFQRILESYIPGQASNLKKSKRTKIWNLYPERIFHADFVELLDELSKFNGCDWSGDSDKEMELTALSADFVSAREGRSPSFLFNVTNDLNAQITDVKRKFWLFQYFFFSVKFFWSGKLFLLLYLIGKAVLYTKHYFSIFYL